MCYHKNTSHNHSGGNHCMYLKTTSPQFLNYGNISDTKPIHKVVRRVYEHKYQTYFKCVDKPFSIELIEGIALLIIQKDDGEHEDFVIHRRAILNPNTPFLIIPLTLSALVEESVESDETFTETLVEAVKPAHHTPIRPQFFITDIFSYYYSVKGQNYVFDGESHLYWEITYVDTGELIIELDNQEFVLQAQELMIYLPGQYHKQRVKAGSSCSYLTIMFDMKIKSTDVERLRNQIFKCTQPMHQLVANFIKNTDLLETRNLPYASDLMVSYLQELIIMMIQYEILNVASTNIYSSPVQNKFETEMIDEIRNYILKEIYSPISVEDICNHFGISRSTLQSLFKKHLNVPPKQFINDLKMKRAREVISEEFLPITEVAIKLGFSSIHYFSRKFKKDFGITPSEFAQSVYKEKL